MRARFLNKIKGQNQVKVESLSKRVICSLFLDFLKQEHFLYTPTVFVPECGSNQMTLSRPELQEYLKIPELNDESVLEFLINRYKASIYKQASADSFVQTEDSPVTDLESRLQQLDSEFLSKTRPDYQSFEDKLVKVRRDCEEKARSELQVEITRIREVEVSQVRIEEASKYREQLRIARNEIEDYWKTQLDELKNRERESKERVLIREKDLELREFRQRDLFEKELEILKTKEKDMKKSVEIEIESARLQKRSWEQKKIEYEEKLKDMETLKNSLKTKAIDDFNQYKRHFEAQFDEEKRKIFTEKFEIENNKEQLLMEYEKIRNYEEKIKEQRADLQDTQKKLDFFQENYEKVLKELGNTRDELRIVSETSRRDLEMLKFKEQELQAVKNECKTYKELFSDQKESMKKLETTNQVIVEKILNEEQYKAKTALESEFLAERQHLWRQIDRESINIKKEMTELITSNIVPSSSIYRNTIRPSFNTFINLESKSKTEVLRDSHFEEEPGRSLAEEKLEKKVQETKLKKLETEKIKIEEKKENLPEKNKKSHILIEHESSESYKSTGRKFENIEESIKESYSEYESEYEQSGNIKIPSKTPEKILFSESSSNDVNEANVDSNSSNEYF